jgi:hypothetical protein
MPLLVTGGCVEGRVPFQEAKCAGGESGDVADLDQQLGGAGRSDAVQDHERAARRGDQPM